MNKRMICLLLAALLCFAMGTALAEDGQASEHIHSTESRYTSTGKNEHECVTYCPTCEETIVQTTEPHTFEYGACIYCDEPCPHDNGYTADIYPIEDTVEWNGSYITYDAMELHICNMCGMAYESKQTKIHEIHQRHEEAIPIHVETNDDATHEAYMVCPLCGFEYHVPVAHEWERVSLVPYNEGHTELLRCTDCGYILETEVHPHTPIHQSWKRSVEGHIETLCCADCGQIYTTGLEEHTTFHYDWLNCDQPGEGFEKGHQEIVKCSICEYTYGTVIEPHDVHGIIFDTCALCGASKHSHFPEKAEYYVPIDARFHRPFGACGICGEDVAFNDEYHDFDPFTLVCTECGYQADECLHDATVEFVKERSDENYHYHVYTCQKCGKQWEIASEHGAYRPVGIATEKNTETEHILIEACIACGYQKEVPTAHTMVYQQSPENHWGECQYCHYQAVQEAHTWDTKDTEKKICSICGYVDHVHHMVHTGYHCSLYEDNCCADYRCDYPGCDRHYFDYVAHVADVSFQYQQDDELFHLRQTCCKNCGHVLSEKVEEHAIENGVCTKCGFVLHVHDYQFHVVDPENPHHTWDECACGDRINEQTANHHFVQVYEIASAQEHRFLFRCDICGFVQSSYAEAHAFVDDTCVRCGYVQGMANDIEFPDAQEPEQGETPEILSEPWYCFTVDGNIVVCIPQVELIEDSGELALILLPASQPQGDERVLTLSREDLRLLCVYQIQQLKLHWNDMDVLLADNLPELYDHIVTENLESIQIKP